MRVLLSLVCCFALASAVGAADEVKVTFIGLDASGKVEVVAIEADNHARYRDRPGLLLWAAGEAPERWQRVTRGWAHPPVVGDVPAAQRVAAGPTRGGGSGSAPASGGLTVQLDPLRPDEMPRALEIAFLTPVDGGILLEPRPTFRRAPVLDGAGKPTFPALEATLGSGRPALKVPLRFAAGQSRLTYSALAGVPKGGLPPGSYTLEVPGLASPIRFTVAEPALRKTLLARSERLGGILGDKSSPLYVQYAVEELLGKPATRGMGRGIELESRYLSDVVELLESLPEAKRTPYLERQRQTLLGWLATPPSVREKSIHRGTVADATKIKAIDQAREAIQAGQWDVARRFLDGADLVGPASKDRRIRGLRHLYLGVVLGEGGLLDQGRARDSFSSALLDLVAPVDRFRAEINFASFLQRQAENRLYNHAFQMATGVSCPFLTLLDDWRAAQDHYAAASGLTGKLASGSATQAIAVSQARLYALLADVVRTLGGEPALEKAAVSQASTLAGEVITRASPDNLDRATAMEILAQLAYRGGDLARARGHAEGALTLYVQGGRLAAVENVERMLGLIEIRQAEGLPIGAKQTAGWQRARDRLEVAHLISESLRDRFPPGRTGATRAAFLARKVFVTDLIAELLLREGKAAEALVFVEQAKARALQDLFAARGNRWVEKERPLEDLLKQWPRGVAAVEYFFGPEKVWVFVIDPSGKVHAQAVVDAEGKPIAPRDLVGSVQTFLRGIEGYSQRMLKRLLSGKGFDHSWQTDLDTFRQQLLPPPVLEILRKADLVVVVPQHVLHYFPFAALVTKRDEKNRGPREMVQPRFLLDETFTLVNAPSLTTWGMLQQRPAAKFDRVQALGLVEAPGADPLPGVGKDLANLKSVFKDRLTIRSGADARATLARGLLARRGMLFLATHGLNDPDQPLDSHLLLLPDDSPKKGSGSAEDGKLRAVEIFSATVKTPPDLVVLSACYSGLADRSPLPGDDLFGLQRALLAIDVRTVVAGLWDVYDETAPDLMLGLFERVNRGEPAAAALAGSQRAFLAKYRKSTKVEPYLHPYFWAVYVAAGDQRTAMGK